MNRVCFLYNTLFGQAVLATDPPDHYEEGWPTANIQTSVLAEAWKAPSPGNVRLLIDLRAPQAVNALGLASHNLRAECPVTLRVYSDAWITEIFSQTWEAVGPLVGWLEGGWLDGGWLGYPQAGDQLLYPRVTSLLVCDQITGGRYVAVDFANADPFYLGALFLGELFIPARNFSFGYDLTPVDDTSQEESLGGVVFSDLGEQYHQFRFSLNHLTEAEALGGAFWRFARYVGRRKPFIVRLMNATLKHERLTTMVGVFSANPASKGWGPDHHRADFVIREMI
jgi:hypothetical protein